MLLALIHMQIFFVFVSGCSLVVRMQFAFFPDLLLCLGPEQSSLYCQLAISCHQDKTPGSVSWCPGIKRFPSVPRNHKHHFPSCMRTKRCFLPAFQSSHLQVILHAGRLLVCSVPTRPVSLPLGLCSAGYFQFSSSVFRFQFLSSRCLLCSIMFRVWKPQQ